MRNKATNDMDRIVGQRIVAFRKASGLSQTGLGDAIGVTFQQVQKYEKGLNRIAGTRLHQMAKLFGVSLSTLFGEDEPKGQTEALSFLTETGAIELLHAYVAINNDQLRRDVLQLVRTISRTSVRPVGGSE